MSCRTACVGGVYPGGRISSGPGRQHSAAVTLMTSAARKILV